MQLQTVETVKLLLVLSCAAMFLLIVCGAFIALRYKNGFIRNLVLILICLGFACNLPGLIWSSYRTFTFYHDFRVLYGYSMPDKLGARIELRPKIVEALLYRKKRAEEKIANYQKEKVKIEAMPRGTTDEVMRYVSAQESLHYSLWYVCDVQAVFERARLSAYYAGFQAEVLAIPDVDFSEQYNDLPHTKFTK